MNQKVVLITEDDPAILDALEMVFTRDGYKVISLTNGSSILDNDFETPDNSSRGGKPPPLSD